MTLTFLGEEGESVSLCSPGCPQTCDPLPTLDSMCWDYKHLPPHPADIDIFFPSALWICYIDIFEVLTTVAEFPSVDRIMAFQRYLCLNLCHLWVEMWLRDLDLGECSGFSLAPSNHTNFSKQRTATSWVREWRSRRRRRKIPSMRAAVTGFEDGRRKRLWAKECG
jgi:hypothetical protein